MIRSEFEDKAITTWKVPNQDDVFNTFFGCADAGGSYNNPGYYDVTLEIGKTQQSTTIFRHANST